MLMLMLMWVFDIANTAYSVTRNILIFVLIDVNSIALFFIELTNLLKLFSLFVFVGFISKVSLGLKTQIGNSNLEYIKTCFDEL